MATTTIDDGLGDDASHERVGTDGIVVTRNGVLHEVGVDVGIDHCDDGDTELVGFGDGDLLFLGVEDEHGVGTLGHATDTTEVLLQLLELTRQQEGFLLRHRFEFAGLLHALVLEHLRDALAHGFEVGEHAAEPALVHIWHVRVVGEIAHGILRLLLGADEQHGATLGRDIAGEVVGGLDAGECLLEIDDVDAIALAVDEALHLWVPAAGLVPEVDTCFQHLSHGDDGHDVLLHCGLLRSAPCALCLQNRLGATAEGPRDRIRFTGANRGATLSPR